MELATYLDYLRSDGKALGSAARRAPAATIPSCPEWDMTALLAHVGSIHRWVAEVVGTGATEYLKRSPAKVEGAQETLAWYEEGVAALVDTLSAADPDAPVWNWYHRGAAPGRFWWRRMAHETAVHRWDAEAAGGGVAAAAGSGAAAAAGAATAGAAAAGAEAAAGSGAAGGPSPIGADLAVDGMDEYLTFAALMVARQPVPGLGGSLHLHATDVAGEWALDLEPDHIEYRMEHSKSDTAVRGSASDLLLLMLNRIPAESPSLQVFGDGAVLKRWREIQF
jgi:uncharacterized protein (TIGR03083 family)